MSEKLKLGDMPIEKQIELLKLGAAAAALQHQCESAALAASELRAYFLRAAKEVAPVEPGEK